MHKTISMIRPCEAVRNLAMPQMNAGNTNGAKASAANGQVARMVGTSALPVGK